MASLEFNSICRLCVQLLDREKVSPIFNNPMYDDKISLPERIRYCSSIEVAEGDGLPPQICSSCLLKLNQSFIFRNQCVLADLTLKRLKDMSFNVGDISNLLKVDIENQIIKAGCDDCQIAQSTIVDEERKNEICIDEFDNSKNGRHKKNINKSKDRCLQRGKNLNQKKENEPGFLELSDNISKNNSQSFTQNGYKKKKERLRKKVSIKENKSKANKLSTGEDEESERIKPDNQKKTEIENFTIGPDMLNVAEVKENHSTGTESLELNLVDSTKKTIKKITKPKSAGLKKGRTKKLGTAKEKPSSYTCDYCQKVYPSEGGWRYHIHTMHNENYQPFICDLCGQAFKVKKNLEGHKNSIHFHLKLHLCDLCGRGFASKYALKVHKIWHNDEKNFTCDICGTKFRTRGKMNTHRSIHGGPKKFMCHICSRDFRWKKDFEIHMRTHTGEKPFKCSHCGKAFASLTNMKKHERNHVEKLETTKNSEAFDMMIAATVDERMYKNEFLDFGYGSEDVRNREINPL